MLIIFLKCFSVVSKRYRPQVPGWPRISHGRVFLNYKWIVFYTLTEAFSSNFFYYCLVSPPRKGTTLAQKTQSYQGREQHVHKQSCECGRGSIRDTPHPPEGGCMEAPPSLRGFLSSVWASAPPHSLRTLWSLPQKNVFNMQGSKRSHYIKMSLSKYSKDNFAA